MEMSSKPPEMKVQPSPNTNSDEIPPNYSQQQSSSLELSSPSPEQIETAAALRSQRILNLQFLNTTSYLLTALITLGLIHFRAHEEGIYGDEYLWMKYQTLLSPAEYTEGIWYVVWGLLGGFVVLGLWGSYRPTKEVIGKDIGGVGRIGGRIGEGGEVSVGRYLIGYEFIHGNYPGLCTTQTNEEGISGVQHIANIASRSPAALFPALCCATILMVYSYDYGYLLLAFLSSLCLIAVLVRIARVQTEIMDEADEVNEVAMAKGAKDGSEGASASAVDMSLNTTLNTTMDTSATNAANAKKSGPTKPITLENMKQYLTLRFPFELYLGYALSLSFLYLHTFLAQIDNFYLFGQDGNTNNNGEIPPKAMFILANLSILTLTLLSSLILWRTRRHFYGLPLSTTWYLIGIAVELKSPTQPIYNSFTDEQISVTQVMASVGSTVVMVLFWVRIVKTVIKRTDLIVPWGEHCKGDEEEEEDNDNCEVGGGEGEPSTNYVQA